ncbi:hypothetical protein BH10PSE9_BH10PSE9_07360 [soil metagenome]
MLDGAYRRRLAADLPKWREAGWVTDAGATAIVGSLGEGRPAFGIAAVIGTMGGLLIGLGVIAFVGANWEEMPRIFRFALLIAAMAVAYVVAGVLESRRLRIFAEAALLVAGLVFAAAIALVGQSYHLSGAYAGAIMLWLVGVFAAAALTASPTLAVVGLVGSGYWTWLATWDLGAAPHWAGLVPVLVGGAIATLLDSRNARILSVLALGFWIALAVISTADMRNWSYVGTVAFGVSIALALWALGALLASFADRRIAGLGHALLWPSLLGLMVLGGGEKWTPNQSLNEPVLMLLALGSLVVAAVLTLVAVFRRSLSVVDIAAVVLIGAAAILFALNVPDDTLLSRLWSGGIVIVAALWAVNLGQSGVLDVGKSTGLAFLGLEVIYLYAFTLGTLINTAVAFLLGGVLFIGLAWGLFRLDRYLAARAAAKASAGATP